MRTSTPLRRPIVVLLGALFLAMSCQQRSTTDTEPASTLKHTVESDFVVRDDDEGGQMKVTVEQSLITEPPQPPQATKAPPRPKPRTATVASIEEGARRGESESALERRAAPHERASTMVVPEPKRFGDRAGEPGVYNPRLVVAPPPIEPPPSAPPLVFTTPPQRDRERSTWTPAEVLLGIGTLSLATGAAAAAAGDGNPDGRILGVTMLGIGVLSYGAAGVLYLNERSSVVVGPGVVRGTF